MYVCDTLVYCWSVYIGKDDAVVYGINILLC
jgi:hypothetical protein